MKIYEYLKEDVKSEINKEIKNKLNAEDVKAWQEAIADEYYSSMYMTIANDPQYEVGEDNIRQLANEYAGQDIDTFIEYCVEHDCDPYKVWINAWITDRILAADTVEELLQFGHIIKK